MQEVSHWVASCRNETSRLSRSSKSTVELHLSGFIGTANPPDKQKIRIIGFLSENRLHWQSEVPLLLLQYVPASKRFDHA